MGRTFFPEPYDEVWVAGRTGLYRVILIDYETQTVELLGIPRGNSMLMGVPFSALRRAERDGAGLENESPG